MFWSTVINFLIFLCSITEAPFVHHELLRAFDSSLAPKVCNLVVELSLRRPGSPTTCPQLGDPEPGRHGLLPIANPGEVNKEVSGPCMIRLQFDLLIRCEVPLWTRVSIEPPLRYPRHIVSKLFFLKEGLHGTLLRKLQLHVRLVVSVRQDRVEEVNAPPVDSQ